MGIVLVHLYILLIKKNEVFNYLKRIIVIFTVYPHLFVFY